ncbi:hypothetical protein E2C01_075259 [Portunus trituberculatus]|uniref:SMB domain-containing protein n=1 Tax=Portunus trituberculatus TaxID=210409 RepID=A0A5B7IEJ3_PORTR|nr:hypothetical protein [Portunus trituberculatus]
MKTCLIPLIYLYTPDGRGCSCDATCRQYGDCCRDSQYYDAAEQTKNVNEYECVDDPLYDGVNVYMRAKCLEKWNNTEVQALCLMGNTQTGDSKLFPVISTTTATTYVNHYCALCNGEETASLRMWQLLMECQNEGASNEDYNVGFHEGQWGIITPSLGLSSFQPCFFSLQIPNDLWNYTKPCLTIVKTCSDLGVNQRDQILGQSYTAFVYHENFTFRNQHCAFCMLELLVKAPVPPIVILLLDFSDTCGRVGHECRCNSEELWDKWFKKCMKAFCSKPNEKFHIDKCVPH